MPLTYICANCKKSFTSLLLDRQQAVADIGPQLQKHIITEHMDQWQKFERELGQLTTIAAGVASVNRFIEYEEDDLTSIEEHEQNCSKLMELLGFEEEEAEEPEEENKIINLAPDRPLRKKPKDNVILMSKLNQQ